MRWLLSMLLALITGLASLFAVTDGFTVLTAESARRQAIARQARSVPETTVFDAQGRTFSMRGNLATDGRVAIVSFFYSRCISLCLAQGFLTERLQNAIEVSGLSGQIRLISLSFDDRDQADALTHYSERMQADSSVWQVWSFSNPTQRDDILRLFGITVVPASLGQFEHNAAYHLVTPNGHLVGIVNDDQPGLALSEARRLAADLVRVAQALP